MLKSNLWRSTDYGWWLGADTCSSLSGSVAMFAIPLIAMSITGASGVSSTLDAMMSFISAMLVIPGGLVQDRYDRRTLMILSYVLDAAILTIAAVLIQFRMLSVVTLVVICLLLGVNQGLLGETSNTMLRGVVSNEELPRVMAMNDSRDAIVSIIGSPVSGALMGIGKIAPFLGAVAMNIVGVIAALRIKRYWHRGVEANSSSAPKNDGAEEPIPSWRDAFGGLVWLMKVGFQRRLLFISAISMNGFNVFLLLTMLDLMQSGMNTARIGLIDSATAVGMLVGAVIVSALIDRTRGGVLVAICFTLLTFSMIGATIAEGLLLKCVCLMFAVIGLPAANAAIGGFQSTLIGKDKMGRAFAGVGLVRDCVYPILATMSGWIMQFAGYRTAAVILIAFETMCLALCLTSRPLITLPTPDRWQSHADRWHLEKF